MRSSIAPAPLWPRTRRLTLALAGAVAIASSMLTAPDVTAQAAPTQATQPRPSPLSPAWSDPRAAATALEQARRLIAEGQRADAMKVIDAGLVNSPRDAALRFTRAVLLADAGRIDDAAQAFTELTQEFPELPEPHNNLAALYAARGELDKARAALDNAVRALPSYALAWDNLGDVHLRIAERAWARAASIDASSGAQAKLKLARELIERISPAGARPATVNLPGKQP